MRRLLSACLVIVDLMVMKLILRGTLCVLVAIVNPLVESWELSTIRFDYLHGLVSPFLHTHPEDVTLALPYNRALELIARVFRVFRFFLVSRALK